MTLSLWMLTAAAAWLAVAAPVAVVIGKAVHRADCCPHPDVDDDLMALVQAENLSPAEVDRRIARMETWL